MPASLKRVSKPTEAAILAISTREGRTFVAQLDRVVAAGLAALGEDVPPEIALEPTPTPTTRRKQPAKAS